MGKLILLAIVLCSIAFSLRLDDVEVFFGYPVVYPSIDLEHLLFFLIQWKLLSAGNIRGTKKFMVFVAIVNLLAFCTQLAQAKPEEPSSEGFRFGRVKFVVSFGMLVVAFLGFENLRKGKIVALEKELENQEKQSRNEMQLAKDLALGSRARQNLVDRQAQTVYRQLVKEQDQRRSEVREYNKEVMKQAHAARREDDYEEAARILLNLEEFAENAIDPPTTSSTNEEQRYEVLLNEVKRERARTAVRVKQVEDMYENKLGSLALPKIILLLILTSALLTVCTGAELSPVSKNQVYEKDTLEKLERIAGNVSRTIGDPAGYIHEVVAAIENAPMITNEVILVRFFDSEVCYEAVPGKHLGYEKIDFNRKTLGKMCKAYFVLQHLQSAVQDNVMFPGFRFDTKKRQIHQEKLKFMKKLVMDELFESCINVTEVAVVALHNMMEHLGTPISRGHINRYLAECTENQQKFSLVYWRVVLLTSQEYKIPVDKLDAADYRSVQHAHAENVCAGNKPCLQVKLDMNEEAYNEYWWKATWESVKVFGTGIFFGSATAFILIFIYALAVAIAKLIFEIIPRFIMEKGVLLVVNKWFIIAVPPLTLVGVLVSFAVGILAGLASIVLILFVFWVMLVVETIVNMKQVRTRVPEKQSEERSAATSSPARSDIEGGVSSPEFDIIEEVTADSAHAKVLGWILTTVISFPIAAFKVIGDLLNTYAWGEKLQTGILASFMLAFPFGRNRKYLNILIFCSVAMILLGFLQTIMKMTLETISGNNVQTTGISEAISICFALLERVDQMVMNVVQYDPKNIFVTPVFYTVIFVLFFPFVAILYVNLAQIVFFCQLFTVLFDFLAMPFIGTLAEIKTLSRQKVVSTEDLIKLAGYIALTLVTPAVMCLLLRPRVKSSVKFTCGTIAPDGHLVYHVEVNGSRFRIRTPGRVNQLQLDKDWNREEKFRDYQPQLGLPAVVMKAAFQAGMFLSKEKYLKHLRLSADRDATKLYILLARQDKFSLPIPLNVEEVGIREHQIEAFLARLLSTVLVIALLTMIFVSLLPESQIGLVGAINCLLPKGYHQSVSECFNYVETSYVIPGKYSFWRGQEPNTTINGTKTHDDPHMNHWWLATKLWFFAAASVIAMVPWCTIQQVEVPTIGPQKITPEFAKTGSDTYPVSGENTPKCSVRFDLLDSESNTRGYGGATVFFSKKRQEYHLVYPGHAYLAAKELGCRMKIHSRNGSDTIIKDIDESRLLLADLAAIQLTQGDISKLHVKRANAAEPLPMQYINTLGYDPIQKKFVTACGEVVPQKQYDILAYRASTNFGYCGFPVFSGQKIFAIHIAGRKHDNIGNIGYKATLVQALLDHFDDDYIPPRPVITAIGTRWNVEYTKDWVKDTRDDLKVPQARGKWGFSGKPSGTKGPTPGADRVERPHHEELERFGVLENATGVVFIDNLNFRTYTAEEFEQFMKEYEFDDSNEAEDFQRNIDRLFDREKCLRDDYQDYDFDREPQLDTVDPRFKFDHPNPYFGQVPTPDKVCERIAQLIPPDTKVVHDHFSGKGAIGMRVKAKVPEVKLRCFEIDPKIARESGTMLGEDAEIYVMDIFNTDPSNILFQGADFLVANPPYPGQMQKPNEFFSWLRAAPRVYPNAAVVLPFRRYILSEISLLKKFYPRLDFRIEGKYQCPIERCAGWHVLDEGKMDVFLLTWSNTEPQLDIRKFQNDLTERVGKTCDMIHDEYERLLESIGEKKTVLIEEKKQASKMKDTMKSLGELRQRVDAKFDVLAERMEQNDLNQQEAFNALTSLMTKVNARIPGYDNEPLHDQLDEMKEQIREEAKKDRKARDEERKKTNDLLKKLQEEQRLSREENARLREELKKCRNDQTAAQSDFNEAGIKKFVLESEARLLRKIEEKACPVDLTKLPDVGDYQSLSIRIDQLAAAILKLSDVKTCEESGCNEIANNGYCALHRSENTCIGCQRTFRSHELRLSCPSCELLGKTKVQLFPTIPKLKVTFDPSLPPLKEEVGLFATKLKTKTGEIQIGKCVCGKGNCRVDMINNVTLQWCDSCKDTRKCVGCDGIRSEGEKCDNCSAPNCTLCKRKCKPNPKYKGARKAALCEICARTTYNCSSCTNTYVSSYQGQKEKIKCPGCKSVGKAVVVKFYEKMVAGKKFVIPTAEFDVDSKLKDGEAVPAHCEKCGKITMHVLDEDEGRCKTCTRKGAKICPQGHDNAQCTCTKQCELCNAPAEHDLCYDCKKIDDFCTRSFLELTPQLPNRP